MLPREEKAMRRKSKGAVGSKKVFMVRKAGSSWNVTRLQDDLVAGRQSAVPTFNEDSLGWIRRILRGA